MKCWKVRLQLTYHTEVLRVLSYAVVFTVGDISNYRVLRISFNRSSFAKFRVYLTHYNYVVLVLSFTVYLCCVASCCRAVWKGRVVIMVMGVFIVVLDCVMLLSVTCCWRRKS